MGRTKKIVCHGVKFDSIGQLCQHYEVSYVTVYRDIKSGLSVDDAIDKCLAKKITLFDSEGSPVVYRSALDLCTKIGIDYAKFLRNQKNGMTPEENIENLIGTSDGVEETKLDAKAICASLDIPYRRYSLYRSQGLSRAEAIEKCRQSAEEKKVYVLNGIQYRSQLELCKENGLSYRKFNRFLRDGLSVKDAADASRMSDLRSHAMPVTIDGQRYPSQRAYCREHGITLSVFQRKIKEGKIKV